MSELLRRLRADSGTKTLGQLIQEREAAANEIERLLSQLAEYRASSIGASRNTTGVEETHHSRRVPWQDRALLRLSEVCAIVGLSRSTIYGRMANGTFPRPVQMSERAVRWRSADIAAWLSGLSRGR